LTGVDLSAFDPSPQRLGLDIEELTDPATRFEHRLGGEVPLSILIHPDRPITGLLVVLPGCRHSSVSL
jgi:hypothetical protein